MDVRSGVLLFDLSGGQHAIRPSRGLECNPSRGQLIPLLRREGERAFSWHGCRYRNLIMYFHPERMKKLFKKTISKVSHLSGGKGKAGRKGYLASKGRILRACIHLGTSQAGKSRGGKTVIKGDRVGSATYNRGAKSPKKVLHYNHQLKGKVSKVKRQGNKAQGTNY